MTPLILVLAGLGLGLVGGGLVKGAIGQPLAGVRHKAKRTGKKLWNWTAAAGLAVAVVMIINARNGAA